MTDKPQNTHTHTTTHTDNMQFLVWPVHRTFARQYPSSSVLVKKAILREISTDSFELISLPYRIYTKEVVMSFGCTSWMSRRMRRVPGMSLWKQMMLFSHWSIQSRHPGKNSLGWSFKSIFWHQAKRKAVYPSKKNAYALKTPHAVSVHSFSSVSSLASMNSESHSIERPIETFFDLVTLTFDL